MGAPSYYDHNAGYYHPPLDLIEWEETVEAITLETNTTSRPVMNSPADEAEARDRDMRLHGKRIATPRAEDLTGTSSRPEARPVTATARFSRPAEPSACSSSTMPSVAGARLSANEPRAVGR